MSDDHEIPPVRSDQACAVLAGAMRAALANIAGEDQVRSGAMRAVFLFELTRNLRDPKPMAGILRALAGDLDPAGDVDRDAIIDECAAAARLPDRVGHEWVKDSLYDAVVARCSAAVLKLKREAAP